LQRAQSFQLWIADDITKFAGSMAFVYLHVALFAVWMLVLERSAAAPFGGMLSRSLAIRRRRMGAARSGANLPSSSERKDVRSTTDGGNSAGGRSAEEFDMTPAGMELWISCSWTAHGRGPSATSMFAAAPSPRSPRPRRTVERV
jgi:hypothetical protein